MAPGADLFSADDPGDLFPGVLAVTRFRNDTHPNSSSHYFRPGPEPKCGLLGMTMDNIGGVNVVITANLSFAS